MANAGADDNASQFFFTLDRTDELQKKHTIFGKVCPLFAFIINLILFYFSIVFATHKTMGKIAKKYSEGVRFC